MARRKDRRGIGKPWTIRPDQEMAAAVEEDLAVIRATLGKKANRTDVVRSWARIGNRTRLIRTLADYQTRLETIEQHAQAATREANALKRKMAGLESKQGKDRGRSIEPALRALRAPGNDHLRSLLAHLVREEAAHRPTHSNNVTLAKAHREFGSWKALQDLFQENGGTS